MPPIPDCYFSDKRVTTVRLKQLLLYSPETGRFQWKVFRGGGAPKVGESAGYLTYDGNILRRVIKIDGKAYYASVLVWFYVHGVWPVRQVDHINRNALDDRVRNLRLATKSQNQANTRKYRHSKAPYRGITFRKKTGRWVAQIGIAGVTHGLGTFDNPEGAARAYDVAAKKRFGEFAQLNFPIKGD